MTPRDLTQIRREITERETMKAELVRELSALHEEEEDAMAAQVCRDAGGHRWIRRGAVNGEHCAVCGKERTDE